MISPFSLQEAQLDDPREKILLPPTDPNAEVMEIPGFKLVYVGGACPRNYRVYKADSMIGVIFPSVAKLTREERKSCNLDLVAK